MSSRKRKRSGFADGASTSGSSGVSSSQKRERSDFADGASTSGYKYDVFLSFRGPDSRLTVADVLYESLVDAGFRVFRDNEELPVGENIGQELEGAIDDSRIYVPIFSEGYASSPWCLQELAHMVKRRRESAGHEIVPVFSGASPSDVRLKRGPYVDDLLGHERRYGEQRVREWKEALREVADLKGWDTRNLGLGKLVKDLVRELSIKLKKKQRVLPDHLVGIDDRVKDVVQWLDCGSLDVKYLVVHGMGGIGKTTLVKAVYNEIAHLFDGCSFLSDIRESSERKGIVALQEQLLFDILKRTADIHDADEGINMIQSGFRSKKVLIVLDNVDDVGQLMALAKTRDWFGRGSRIIITTRDVGLLRAKAMGQQDCVYEMTELNPCHALQLFSEHAFRETLPSDDRENLASEIVAATGGIPLALEVLGSYLYDRSLKMWVEALQRLKRSSLHESVQETLRISYGALSVAQQRIFLDIACFFVGGNSRIVVYMWEDLGFSPESELAALTDMSLLKIDHRNTIWMHDLIREFGRTIVLAENPLDLGERSRLWLSVENVGVLGERVKLLRNVELLGLQLPREQTLTSEDFAALPKLRGLHVEGVNFTGDYNNVFRELRWLSWDRCPAQFDATNFSPSNLVVLKLSGTDLGDDWQGWHQILKSSKLKALELKECSHLTRTPDLSALSTLERLIVQNCESLVEIGESIGKLVQLNYLEIDACTHLRGLPEEVGCLKALKELIVRGTLFGPVGSYLPHSIGNLQSLKRLEMESVGISELPHSIGELKDLEKLCLSRCDELRELPDSIGRLASLLELDLSCTKVTELPDSIGNLRKVKVMRISHSLIRKIPGTIGMEGNLVEFHAEKCVNLKGEIPSGIGSLSFMKILNLSYTCIRSLPTTINQLSHLHELHLEGCHKLKQIPELPASLIILHVESRSLETVPDLSNLINLIDLIVSDCFEESLSNPWVANSIQTPNLGWVGRLFWLEKLKLVHKSIIVPPTELASLPSLERLVLSCCDPSLAQPLPSTLSMLKLINFKSLSELLPRSDLKKLCSLELCKSWLTEIPLNWFGQLENLRELTMSNCTCLQQLSCLSGFKKLRAVHLLKCPRLVKIQGLEELESLESIRIDQCSSLVMLPSLFKLKKLSTMEFISCRSLMSLPSLSRVASEDCHLVVDGCDKLADHNGPYQLHKYKRQCPNPVRACELKDRQHSPCPVSI